MSTDGTSPDTPPVEAEAPATPASSDACNVQSGEIARLQNVQSGEIARLQKILIGGFAVLAILASLQLGGCGARVTAHLPAEWGETLENILAAVQPPPEEAEPPATPEPAAPAAAPVAPPTPAPAPVPAPSQLDRIEGRIGALEQEFRRHISLNRQKRDVVWRDADGNLKRVLMYQYPSAGFAIAKEGSWLKAILVGGHYHIQNNNDEWVPVVPASAVRRAFATTD